VQQQEGQDQEEELSGRVRVRLRVLETAKAAQRANGLAHRDYLRYRQYCARRLRRLRRRLRKHEDVTRALQEPLLCAERAWAHAMLLKQENHEEGEAPRRRLHLLRRLRKAAHWADQLKEQCSQKADDRTVLEAEAYAAWMRGNLLLEKEDWRDAFVHFSRADDIYARLLDLVEPELRELMRERVDEIRPAIRYCQYNVKRSSGHAANEALQELRVEGDAFAGNELLQAKFNKIMEESREQEADQAAAFPWKARSIAVRSTSMRVKLLEIREKLAVIEGKSGEDAERAFLETVSVCDDAIRLAREEEVRIVKTMQTVNAADQVKTEFQCILAYVKGMKLRASLKRSFMQVKQKGSSDEQIIMLYERILQTIEDLRAVLAVSEEENSSKDDFPEELDPEAISLDEDLSRAGRCLSISHMFFSQGRWPETLALLDRNLERVGIFKTQRQVSSSQSALLQFIENESRKLKSITLAKSFKQGKQEMRPAVEGKVHLSALPPPIEAIPGYPVLVDLALHHLKLGDIPEAAEKKTKTDLQEKNEPSPSQQHEQQHQQQQQQQSGGWFSKTLFGT